jgi:lipopolysaccharide/colanic/teichoic acid biosynthesis glycosyltransferase
MQRIFDVIVSASALLFLAVLLAAIALVLKVSSRGPIMYRQPRVGRGAQLFSLYKFRTMRVDAGGPSITVEGDPRITPIGHILRRWKLDELPQLWNVLRGDMSIIGPRPEVEHLVRHYSAEQRRLLQRRPGLAGLSQLVYPHEADMLRGYPNPEEMYLRYLLPRKLEVDLQYERQRTFWSDLRLLVEIACFSVLGKSQRIDRTLQLPLPKLPPG